LPNEGKGGLKVRENILVDAVGSRKGGPKAIAEALQWGGNPAGGGGVVSQRKK